MAKKKHDRGGERRRRQRDQARRRNKRRQAVQTAMGRVNAAFTALSAAAAGTEVSVVELADQVVALFDDALAAGMLASSDFGRDRGAGLAEEAGEERARALAAELAGRLEAEPRLVWFAAGCAEESGDLDAAERMLAGAVDTADPETAADAASWLGGILLGRGMLAAALDLAERECARRPDHDGLQGLQARCMAHARLAVQAAEPDADMLTLMAAKELGVEAPGADEVATARAALDRFADRSVLYEMREAIEAFVRADPALEAWRDGRVAEILAMAREEAGLGPFDRLGDDGLLRLQGTPDGAGTGAGTDGAEPSAAAGFAALALELTWLFGPEDPDAAGDLPDEHSVLGRFADHPGTPPHLGHAARSWLREVRYGLWQPDIAAPGESDRATRDGGVWVIDLVTRRRVYAEIPPEQLGGLPRWSVLAGALAPLSGVWRSGVAMAVLDPGEADRCAETFLDLAESALFDLAKGHGIKTPHRSRSIGAAAQALRPHGVLAALEASMEPHEANFASRFFGAGLGVLIGMLERDRRRTPQLTNTDGDPLDPIEATFPCADPLAAREVLLTRRAFEGDDPGEHGDVEEGEIAPPLSWLGREMTPGESTGALANMRGQAKKRGWGPIEEPAGPQYWLRGTVRFLPGAIRVEVNSAQRFESAKVALRAVVSGEPEVRHGMNPALDLPLPAGGLRGGRAPDPEVEAAWRASWLDEKVPALDGSTPRDAARDPWGRYLLEALLRSFEHDADLAVLAGERPMNVDALRSALAAEDGALLDPVEGGGDSER